MASLKLPKSDAEQALQIDVIAAASDFGAVFLQRSGPGNPLTPAQFLSGVHLGGDAKILKF